MNRDIVYALGAAALFGASTPLAKWLAGEIPPVLLAGLLYLGSGLGLTLARVVRDGGFNAAGSAKNGGRRALCGRVFCGGLGWVGLTFGGLARGPGRGTLLF